MKYIYIYKSMCCKFYTTHSISKYVYTVNSNKYHVRFECCFCCCCFFQKYNDVRCPLMVLK